MSKISLTPNASGTGTFTLASPNSNTNRTLTLPDAAGELLTTTGDGSGLTGIVIPAVFQPVAVTGATPSLDVGTYNYFDQGSMTADTTVSFASVPTEANWRYSFSLDNIAVPWDVSAAVYRHSLDVSALTTSPADVFFKPDGTKMYMLGLGSKDVHEHDLRVAWDVSTAVFLQDFYVGSQEGAPVGLFFKPDGTKMYVVGYSGDDVNEYDLSTAWDVSTAVFLQLFSVATQDVNPYGVTFKPDGTKMYVIGTQFDSVYEYNLSTAWNVSTASYLQLFSVAGQETTPYGVTFKPDGTKMYVLGSAGDDVNEYDLSTAWNVTTAVLLQNFSVVAQEATPRGFFFKPDGTKMYVIGSGGNAIDEYDLADIPAITLPAAVVGTPNALSADDRVTYEFVTLDGGTTVNLIAQEVIAT